MVDKSIKTAWHSYLYEKSFLPFASFFSIRLGKPSNVAVDLVKRLQICQFFSQKFCVNCHIIISFDQPFNLKSPIFEQMFDFSKINFLFYVCYEILVYHVGSNPIIMNFFTKTQVHPQKRTHFKAAWTSNLKRQAHLNPPKSPNFKSTNQVWSNTRPDLRRSFCT